MSTLPTGSCPATPPIQPPTPAPLTPIAAESSAAPTVGAVHNTANDPQVNPSLASVFELDKRDPEVAKLGEPRNALTAGTSGREGEKRVDEAQYAALQKTLLEMFQVQGLAVNVPTSILPAAAVSADSEQILEQAFKDFESREKQRQLFADQLNTMVKNCNQFFRELKREHGENLKPFLQKNSEKQYSDYNLSMFYPFSFCSWLTSNLERIQKQQNESASAAEASSPIADIFNSECVSLLDQHELSACRANFTMLSVKLRTLKLDSYLNEIPPELQALKNIAIKFLQLPDKIPQNETEMKLWCNQWRTEEKYGLAQLISMAMTKTGDMVPVAEVNASLPKLKNFMDRLDKNLEPLFHQEISMAFLHTLAEMIPSFKPLVSIADESLKKTSNSNP